MAVVISQRFGYWAKPRNSKTHGCIDEPLIVEPHVSPPPGLSDADHELQAPPGLEHMVKNVHRADEPRYAPLPDYWNTHEPIQYKVLLQNIPQPLLKECLLWAMIDQGKLKDVADLTFRSNGRALLTLRSEDSMNKCIRHFNGRKWACSEKPVKAFQVRTVSSLKPQEDSWSVPMMAKDEARSRTTSSASTESGRTIDDGASVSDDCWSEKDSFTSFS
jgi:hypothetical protein|mmetsp:Transcript_87494/g.136960  ORF Transcript_87494/g.136960 Transcript_87494/m.136960 type:complete len:218 (+) Transcript_87494:46-699(+)